MSDQTSSSVGITKELKKRNQDISARFVSNVDSILGLWEKRALAQITSAKGIGRRTLRDSFPKLLENLALTLASDIENAPAEAKVSGEEHGSERISLSDYNLEEILFEYHLLQETVFEVLDAEEPLPLSVRQMILKSIQTALRSSAVEYSRLEKEREANEKELASERLKLAIEAAEIGDWDLDLVSHVSERSLKHDQIFGYESLQPHWNIETAARHVVEEDRPRFKQDLELAFQNGVFKTQVRVTWPDNSIHWISAQGRVYYDKDKKPVRMTGVVMDVTERMLASLMKQKLLEQEKEKAVLLKQINSKLEQFASVAAHDLKEPLRTIAGYTNLLERKYNGKLDEEANEYLAFVMGASGRMRQLIDDLLNFSQVSAEVKKVDNVDLALVLENAIKNLAGAIEENKAEIEIGPLPKITGDYSQLVQLFQNLLSNGLKYHGDKAPVLSVSAMDQGSDWLFKVCDNGIGFEKTFAEQIFEPFKRLHTRDLYKGTGIGLTICKKIVERHGGIIWATSEPGKGSEFVFTLSAH